MVEYFKIVLNGVSEDRSLFEKELRKALIWMTKDELSSLKVWLRERFYPQYKTLIDEVFYPSISQAS